ncbi:MAG: 23S rRNA (guanosine(2251)-2'-O)-methyltransferase RlmB, partial [Clostridia bacterium]|nr:23S rRNA (guanosine(2251)-2'-O)-methyltransferase RlmB [Clostridia bacterium]
MKIEGKNPVKEALDSDKEISKLYISKSARDLQRLIDVAKAKGIRVEFVDKFYLDKISESGRHQGAIAIAEDFRYTDVDDIIAFAKSKNQRLFMILLDGIEDPHNLGSILRVAECMGAHGVVIPSRRSACVNATVLRASAGSANHIRVAMVGNINAG